MKKITEAEQLRLMKKYKSAGKILVFLKPYWLALILGVLFTVVSCVANAVAPMTEGLITTRLVKDAADIAGGVPGAGVDFGYILTVMAVLACIYLSNSGFLCAANFMITNAIQNSMKDLRNAVENKIRRLPVSYFDSNSFGNVLSRITNDVDTVSNALQQGLIQVINAVLLLTFAITMMFTINVVMAVVALLIIPASFLISRFIVHKSQRLFDGQQNALGALNGTVQEMYTGFSEIKLYGKQKDAVREFKEANEKLRTFGFRAQFISSLLSPLISFVTYLGIGAIAVIGPIYAIRGVITVGNLQAFVRYIWQVNQPLSQVSQLSAAAQSAYSALRRIFEFMEEEEEVPEAEQPVRLETLRGDVTFDHVRFGYSDDKILIEDLSAEVKSGQMVAIVGPTGAGKTTLINLLMRFYDVKGGAIRIDGVDIRQMRREDLRSLFGMVLQDTWLFQGSIRDNIAYGRFGATDEEIVAAAKTANVHHFIKTLPDGYRMQLNEETSNISQGEKQLLTIARAILSDPKILILDEATSSVDTRLEMLLQNAMKNVMKGRTSFVIAHRLSTIRSADLILVVDRGSIVEQGTHEELIAKGGFYEKLYNSQFASKTAGTILPEV